MSAATPSTLTIKKLLERNNLWSTKVLKYSTSILDDFPSCLTKVQPEQTTKVSLSAMRRQFNTAVCVEHRNLDDNWVFHIMDSTYRYSVGDVFDTVSIWNAITLFETHWLSSFWTAQTFCSILFFDNTGFTDYLNSPGVEARSILPRRHNKNV